jgi:hypothetical protein
MPIRLLPSSGRLIGLFPDGSEDNFLWTNPAPGGAWPNPGGDRTWLAPEIELFIGDVRRPGETYRVPAALDPGNWKQSGSNRLTNSASLRMHRAGRDVSIRLDKEFLPAPSPIAANGLQYAGYTQVTSLETDAPLGIWNLLQLPPGGMMLVATRAPVRPRLVFGALAEGELTIAPELIYWRMALTGPDTKIAIKADALTGRAAYVRPCAEPGMADLVVREFDICPTGGYVDALWEPPHEAGWAFQACCVRNGPEQFNELEYHAPLECRRDESRVWGFRGATGVVMGVAARLLGRSVEWIGKEQRHG